MPQDTPVLVAALPGEESHTLRTAALLLLLSVAAGLLSSGRPDGVAAARAVQPATADLTPWLQRRLPVLPPETVRRKAESTWRRTVDLAAPAVYPSPSYGGIYLRDTFWVTGALANRRLSVAMRRQFARFQRPGGQLPSHFVAWHRGPRYPDDESTILYVVWTCRDHAAFGAPVDLPVLRRAVAYLRRFDQGGFYVSPPGDGRSWLDALRLPQAEALSYTQGLYAVALTCAQPLGSGISRRAVRAAQQAYRALYNVHLGYLPLGRAHPERDVSSLTGEFLALWLLKRPLLPDSAVRSTVTHFAATPAGYKVISTPTGAYLPASAFILPLKPGDYQNGGAWLLYDELALATAYLHGWTAARALMAQRVALDAATGRLFDEYTCTNPDLPCFTFSIPAREDTAWNTFVLVAQALVNRAARHPRPGG